MADAIERLCEAAKEWAPKAPNEWGTSGPGYTVYPTVEAEMLIDAAYAEMTVMWRDLEKAKAEIERLRDKVREQEAI